MKIFLCETKFGLRKMTLEKISDAMVTSSFNKYYSKIERLQNLIIDLLDLKDYVLKLDKVIFLIFQPVVFSLWISLMFLVVVVIQ